MDSPERCHDVAALQTGLDPGAGERSPVSDDFFSLKPANTKSAASAEEELLEFALLPTSQYGHMSLTYWSSKVASKKVTRQPDAQFLYDLGRLPSLIIEVVWTQTTEKLQELSCDYILSSNARIRTVIGFDVDPSAGKVATVSIWRAVYKEGNIAVTCDSTEVRNVSGVKNPDPQAGLRLTLEDFAYPRSPEEYPDLDSVVIFIPVDDLYEILERAEAAQECIRQRNESEVEEGPTPPTAERLPLMVIRRDLKTGVELRRNKIFGMDVMEVEYCRF